MTHTKNIFFGIIGFIIGFLAITFFNDQSISSSHDQTIKKIEILTYDMFNKQSLSDGNSINVDYAYFKRFNQEICNHMEYQSLDELSELKYSIHKISTTCKKLVI